MPTTVRTNADEQPREPGSDHADIVTLLEAGMCDEAESTLASRAAKGGVSGQDKQIFAALLAEARKRAAPKEKASSDSTPARRGRKS